MLSEFRIINSILVLFKHVTKAVFFTYHNLYLFISFIPNVIIAVDLN